MTTNKQFEFEGQTYVRDENGKWSNPANPELKVKGKLKKSLEALANPPAAQSVDKTDRMALISKFLKDVPTPFGSDSTLPCAGVEDYSGSKPTWIPNMEGSTCTVKQTGFSFNWRKDGAKRRHTDHFVFGVDIFDNGGQWDMSDELKAVLTEYGALQVTFNALTDDEKKGKRNPYGVFSLELETLDGTGKGKIQISKDDLFKYQESPIEGKKAFTKKSFVEAGANYREFWSVETTFKNS